MGRLLDSVIAWLMRPRVRRVRRWAFLVTVPVGMLVGHVYGVHQGVLVIAVRAALWGAVAVVAWRLRDERGEALRDLLMHPRGRAFARAELDILTAVPRMIVAVAMRRIQAGMSYYRGTFGLAMALAFTPVVVTEAAAFHLLLRGGAVAWILTAVHAYALLWLWGSSLARARIRTGWGHGRRCSATVRCTACSFPCPPSRASRRERSGWPATARSPNATTPCCSPRAAGWTSGWSSRNRSRSSGRCTSRWPRVASPCPATIRTASSSVFSLGPRHDPQAASMASRTAWASLRRSISPASDATPPSPARPSHSSSGRAPCRRPLASSRP